MAEEPVEPVIDPLLEEANQLFDQEKYDEAIRLYDKLIVERKLGAEPLFMKGECLSNLGKHADSITWYDKAIEIDDENAMIWNGKGNALYHLDKFDQARICFECAYDLDPLTPDYLLSIIETALLTGDLDDAVNMGREALNATEDTRIVVLSWAFSIIAMFLQQKPLNALETIDELVQYMRDVEREYIPGEKFTGAEYDLCGIEKLVGARARGATRRVLQALLSYMKGTIDTSEIEKIRIEESDNILIDDILVEVLPGESGEVAEVAECPDVRIIKNVVEQALVEQINGLVEEYAVEVGFQTFAFLFDEYDWNADRGPAPFLEELDNRFYIDIVDGKVVRLSIDVDLLATALIPEVEASSKPDGSAIERVGSLLSFHDLEELYITAKNLPDVVSVMRHASFGKDKEITLFVNVERIPSTQESLLPLDKIDEITGISEIPADYQLKGKRIVGSMVWTATR